MISLLTQWLFFIVCIENSKCQIFLKSYSNQDIVLQALRETLNQWNRFQSLEINPQIYGLWFSKKVTRLYAGRGQFVFLQRCWDRWKSTCKSIAVCPYLTPRTKVSSKYKSQHLKPFTRKHERKIFRTWTWVQASSSQIQHQEYNP